MGKFLAGGLILLLLGGCAAWTTQVTGVPFLGEVADPRGVLDALAREIMAKEMGPAGIEEHLRRMSGLAAVPWERWTGDYRRDSWAEVYTWRFAHMRADRLQLGVRNSGGSVAEGYALTARFADGRLIGTTVESTRLTKEEVEWLTTNAVSVGVAAIGTGMMLILR